MPVHFSSPYGRIDLDPDHAVARYTRTSLQFPTLTELEIFHENVARALDRLGRARHALVVDLREARGNNTSGLEQALTRGRRRLLAGFLRVGIIVKTATGALQVLRHAGEDGIEVRVFQDDEVAALAFARLSMPTSERQPPRSGVVEAAPASARAPASVRPPASWRRA
jgi:hypothetical protein